MQISDLTSNPRILVERARSNALEHLRPGQLIEAKVLTRDAQNGIKLQIGDTVVLAKTQLSLPPGQKVTLSVAKAPNPLELIVLRNAGRAEVQARAIRAALPIQAPVSRLIDLLQSRIPGGGTNTPGNPMQQQPPARQPTGLQRTADPTLPDPTQTTPRQPGRHPTSPPAMNSADQATQRPLAPQGQTQRPVAAVDQDLLPALQRILSHRLSSTDDLTSTRLRQTFEQSGLLLEARLAAGQQPVNDLKASLLQLLFRLRTRLGIAPGSPRESAIKPENPQQPEAGRQLTELLSQTESSLARVVLNQLRSIGTEEGQRQVWHLEVPFQLAEESDNFQLRIARESANREGRAETIWSVRLDFDLAPLGPISSHLTLNGDEISSHFTAARPDSARRLERAMPDLNQALVRAGLKVGRLSACEGKIEPDRSAQISPAPLLDEQA